MNELPFYPPCLPPFPNPPNAYLLRGLLVLIAPPSQLDSHSVGNVPNALLPDVFVEATTENARHRRRGGEGVSDLQ
jgi:hypothetical protein